MSGRWGALPATVLLAGCALLQPPNPDPAVPRMEDDIAPLGPIVEIGRGETVKGAFRYLVWESRIGTCTKIEYADGDGSSSCGGTLEVVQTVELSSYGGGTGGWDVEGRASDEVAELWLEAENGVRTPVSLISLEAAGHDGQVFYVAVAEHLRPARVIALDADAEVIAEVPIDTGPPPP